MDSTVSSERIAPVSFDRFGGDFDGFSRDLGDSFARFGFAVISDHGVPAERIKSALDATKKFFALPTEAKLKYKLPRARPTTT
jgi:isopenicillin N synthase-like dioxygenase